MKECAQAEAYATQASGSSAWYYLLLVAAAGAALGAGAGSTATGGVSWTNPSNLRSSVSSFCRTSGLSFRNCRAFSRPWPMRSPL